MKQYKVFVNLTIGDPIPFWYHCRVSAANELDATSKAFAEINQRYSHKTYRVNGVAVSNPNVAVAPLKRAIAAA